MMTRNRLFTIPNLLGFYRILAFPFILWLAISGKEDLFVIFIVINLLADVADGFIARRLNLVSEFGARLDSMADNLTYILAFIGVFVFKWDDFQPHVVSFLIFIGMLVLTVLVSLIKFGRFPSFHLYSTKAGGFIQGAFFMLLFTYGFIEPLYYVMVVWGILAAIEHIAIQMVIPKMRSNVKGLYWVLKEKDNQSLH